MLLERGDAKLYIQTVQLQANLWAWILVAETSNMKVQFLLIFMCAKPDTTPYMEVQLLLDWKEFSRHLSNLKLLYEIIHNSDKCIRLGHRGLGFQVCSEIFYVFYLLESSLICTPILSNFTGFKRGTHEKIHVKVVFF